MINHHGGQRRPQTDMYAVEKDAYLLCLHVKPATVFCGVIIFIMSFMNILILLSKFTMDFSMDKENANPSHLDPRFKTNKLIVLYIIAESLKLLISSLLIYGVTRSKPSYLIPFFLMQCFYFFRSVSFFLENYTNMQTSYQNGNVYQREIYGDNLSKGPSKGQDVPPSYQMMIFFFSLLYKLYFITCVFKCYKYLKLKEAAFQLNQELPGAGWQFRQHQQQPVSAAINILHQPAPPQYSEVVVKDGADYPDQKLPSYDEACRIAVPPEVEKNTEPGNPAPGNPANSTNSTTVTINGEATELKSPQDNRNAHA